MRKLLPLLLLVALNFVGAVPAGASSPLGSAENPLFPKIIARPLMKDRNGQNVLFLGDDGKVAADSYGPIVAYDLEVKAESVSPDDTPPRLPFDAARSLDFLKAFYVMVCPDNARSWGAWQVNPNIVFTEYKPDRLVARIVVRPVGGWTAGGWSVHAGFDASRLERTLRCSIYSLGAEAYDAGKGNIYFRARTRQVPEDDRLELRFAAQVHFEGSLAKPPHRHSAQEDVDALLAQFPNDLMGHDDAVRLAERGPSYYDFLWQRLKMVRQNGRSVPDPVLWQRLETAKIHLGFIIGALSRTRTLIIPDAVTPEDRAPYVYRDCEGGGVRAGIGFGGRLNLILSLEAALTSGTLLADEDLRNAPAIARFLQSDGEVAQALKAALANGESYEARQFLQGKAPLPREQRSLITYALNSLINGALLEEVVGLKGFKMKAETRRVWGQKPGSASGYDVYCEWSRRFNRRVLEDVFDGRLVRM